MREGPDIAPVAALIGDPARAAMLTALMDHRALTAGELAREAGVGRSTASAHLAKLCEGGLLTGIKQGRHRYFRLAGREVGDLLERLMAVTEGLGVKRTRPGPRDPELRRSRLCYDHLAGAHAVRMFDSLQERGAILVGDEDEALRLSEAGEAFCNAFGVELSVLRLGRRPLLRPCLDWSERRPHLAGALGAALWRRIEELGWARRRRGARIVDWSPQGERAFRAAFPLQRDSAAP